jgi:hypothetical protein
LPASDWAQKNYALATWEGMAAGMLSSSAAFHTLFQQNVLATVSKDLGAFAVKELS